MNYAEIKEQIQNRIASQGNQVAGDEVAKVLNSMVSELSELAEGGGFEQVQSDWNVTDITSPACILNKPNGVYIVSGFKKGWSSQDVMNVIIDEAGFALIEKFKAGQCSVILNLHPENSLCLLLGYNHYNGTCYCLYMAEDSTMDSNVIKINFINA